MFSFCSKLTSRSLSYVSNSLKTTLQKKLCSDSVDLSGIPLSTRDVQQIAFYLQNNKDSIVAVDISFTELHDDNLRLLLPLLASLPKLSTLALNGNRLTLTILKDLTEMLKEPKNFSSLAWIDLGNNVDIFTMPQPLLVALRRRCSLKSSLPTIYEYTEGQPYSYHLETSIEEPSHYEEEDEEDDVESKSELEPWCLGEKQLSKTFTLHYCERWWSIFCSRLLQLWLKQCPTGLWYLLLPFVLTPRAQSSLDAQGRPVSILWTYRSNTVTKLLLPISELIHPWQWQWSDGQTYCVGGRCSGEQDAVSLEGGWKN